MARESREGAVSTSLGFLLSNWVEGWLPLLWGQEEEQSGGEVPVEGQGDSTAQTSQGALCVVHTWGLELGTARLQVGTQIWGLLQHPRSSLQRAGVLAHRRGRKGDAELQAP